MSNFKWNPTPDKNDLRVREQRRTAGRKCGMCGKLIPFIRNRFDTCTPKCGKQLESIKNRERHLKKLYNYKSLADG